MRSVRAMGRVIDKDLTKYLLYSCVGETMKSEDFAKRAGEILLIPLKPILKVFNWTTDYAGFGAAFVKPIPVLLMLLVISYPGWSFPLWLAWARSVTQLWQYVIYVLWLIQFPVIFSVGVFAGYHIVSTAKEPDYRKVWDVEKSVGEYVELVRKPKASKR